MNDKAEFILRLIKMIQTAPVILDEWADSVEGEVEDLDYLLNLWTVERQVGWLEDYITYRWIEPDEIDDDSEKTPH